MTKSAFTETFCQHASSKFPSSTGAAEVATENFCASIERTLAVVFSTGGFDKTVEAVRKGMRRSLNIEHKSYCDETTEQKSAYTKSNFE